MSDGGTTDPLQRTILVVDDQHSVVVSLEFVLGVVGYRVLKAESGSAALAVAAREKIDAALVDVHMPVMNGFETCARLRAAADATGRSVRVWLMTGAHCGGSLEARALEVGALGIFVKPFAPAEFAARLELGFETPLSPLNSSGSQHQSANAEASP